MINIIGKLKKINFLINICVCNIKVLDFEIRKINIMFKNAYYELIIMKNGV